MPAERERRLARDVRYGLIVAAVALGALGNHAIWVGTDISGQDEKVPSFIGLELGIMLAGLQGFGRFVLDLVPPPRRHDLDLRRDARVLLSWGAGALGTTLVHAAVAGNQLVAAGEAVPAFLTETIVLALASLTQYGVWVLASLKRAPNR